MIDPIRHEQLKKKILAGEVGVGKAVKRLTGTLLRSARSSVKNGKGSKKLTAVEKAQRVIDRSKARKAAAAGKPKKEKPRAAKKRARAPRRERSTGS